jgi:predicted nuclease of restriction endonuclease-like RecB superfamily
VKWGKARRALKFNWEQKRPDAEVEIEERLPDEVSVLVTALEERGGKFRVERATDILNLPGLGLCVPDLVFVGPGGRKVFLEVLGFWSRDAVWKRVELAKKGLEYPILFAVSQRLRVSEKVLDGEDGAALYVYKGKMSPSAVMKKVEGLASAR